MSIPTFDYAIVGAGAAGLHLAVKMAEDPYFAEKQILILDKDAKETNDRTWSFWEKGKSRWDAITEKQWKAAFFHSEDGKSIALDLNDYVYKTIRSSKFYAHCKSVIKEAKNIHWIADDIVKIDGKIINGKGGEYRSSHVFDSRIDAAFLSEERKYSSLSQHFLGWFIETTAPAFDDKSITMMDYRLQWKDHTSFTYILPFTPTFALVEFTLFNNEMLTKEEYEQKLKTYISHHLKLEDYKVKEVEQGIIPMTNYPFTRHHERHLSKIGTAGGWVRPSSGYSFKNADRYSQMMVDNIKKGKPPHKGIAKNRFRFYDSIFLRVLRDRNDLGPKIFETLYTKHKITSMFRFLDEQSTFAEDMRIIFSLNQSAFRSALLKSF